MPVWPRKPVRDKNHFTLYLISSDEAKSWVAHRLRISEAGAGYMHFPLSRDLAWYEQLTAEHLIVQKGQRRWVNTRRARNEAWDARILSVAALHSRLLAGLDLNAWCDSFSAMLKPPSAETPARVNGPPTTIRSKFVWG